MNYSIPAKKYNQRQKKLYAEYCQKCKEQGIEPFPQERYFPLCSVNYGYIIEGKCNQIFWFKNSPDANERRYKKSLLAR